MKRLKITEITISYRTHHRLTEKKKKVFEKCLHVLQ